MCRTESIAPHNLNLTTSWRRVVTFKIPAILPLWKDLPVFTAYEAGGVSQPFWTLLTKEKFLAPTRN
jgi:hypothetical protein